MAENVTNASPEKRPRLRCQATTKAGVQCRSTAVSDVDGLCSLHGGRLDPVALGRRGGKARRKAKGKRGSFREAVRDVLSRDAERHAERLLESGAAGYKLAAEILAVEERREKPEEARPLKHRGSRVVGLRDVVALAIETEQAELLLGFEPTAEQAAAVAMLQEDRQVPSASGSRARVPASAECAPTLAEQDDADHSADADGGRRRT